jgi:hypothetical protein
VALVQFLFSQDVALAHRLAISVSISLTPAKLDDNIATAFPNIVGILF